MDASEPNERTPVTDDGGRPASFAHNLDLAEHRAITRRLAELEPYEREAKALRRRLLNVDRRLGHETPGERTERRILEHLHQHGGMERGLLIAGLDLEPAAVKTALGRLARTGQVHSPKRGYWTLAPPLGR